MLYLKDEVFPFIEKEYKTCPERIAIGHSNGGTFITYCLLNHPQMFNAYIAVSPNLAYDGSQLVMGLEALEPAKVSGDIFFYISKANESSTNGFNDWDNAHKRAVTILNDGKFSGKISLVSQDFSTSQNHYSVFPFATLSGLDAYLDYRFFNARNSLKYYTELSKKGLLDITADFINNLAYDCLNKNKYEDALNVIDYGIEKFPENHNLYDSKGEFYERMGYVKNAAASYKKAMEVLTDQKSKYHEVLFNETLRFYEGNYQRAISKIE